MKTETNSCIHPIGRCMQAAQHQQLDIEKPARGASYPVL